MREQSPIPAQSNNVPLEGIMQIETALHALETADEHNTAKVDSELVAQLIVLVDSHGKSSGQTIYAERGITILDGRRAVVSGLREMRRSRNVPYEHQVAANVLLAKLR